MRLMIIGPQGVGKGTQATLLSQTLTVPHISTGDLFRSNVADRTDLGRRAHEYMSAGELVPDEVTNAMVADRLAGPDTDAGYLLDGFPRTLDQAHWLTATLGAERDLQAVIVLEAPEEELMTRLRLRGRDDDKPDIIRRRLELYRTTTQPLLDHYAELVVQVDGTGEIDQVQERIIGALTTITGPGEPDHADPNGAPQHRYWPRPGWTAT